MGDKNHVPSVCRFLASEYGITPHQTWGDLHDPVLQKWWDDNGGNEVLLSTSDGASSSQAKPPASQIVIMPKPTTPVRTAYLGSWAGVARPDMMKGLDRICSAFWSLDSNGGVSGRASAAYENALRAVGPKVLASVGGWGGGQHFASVFKDPSRRLMAVKNLGGLVYQIGWSGIDIDWEFPSGQGEPEALLAFCQLFKQWYPNLLLTLAVSTSVGYLKGVAGELNKVVDSYYVMTYDYVGSWTLTMGYNSSVVDGAATIRDYLNAGFPASKLNIGCAWYGRKAHVGSTANSGVGQLALQWDELSYGDIAANYLGKQGWTRTWDSSKSSPWLCNSSTSDAISYEDQDAIRVKRQWCIDNKLQGIFCWEWSQDNGTLAAAMMGN
jgi:chitinase